jgi:hypothetical protein
VPDAIEHEDEPLGQEIRAPLRPLHESGEYAEVADRGRELIEATQYAEPLYNLACCQSLAGRTADAIEHLRLAIGGRNVSARSLRTKPTSIQSATSPRSRSWWAPGRATARSDKR